MILSTSGPLSTSNQYVKYTITVTQNSQSIENNTSNVTVSVRFYRTNTGYVTYGTGTVYCKIDGTTYNASVTPSQKITDSGIVLFTKTMDIPHNADGSKTLTCSAWISHNAPLSSNEQPYNQVLTTIPRNSTLSANNGTLGTAQELTVSRQSSSFTHTITYKCGSASGTICTKSTNTNISFTPPISLASQNISGDSVNIVFTIETFNGNKSVGTNTKTISCAIPSSVKPSVSISVSDEMGYFDTYGGYIQGLSKLNIVVTASGSQGSTIKSRKTEVDGKSYTATSIITGVISGTGTLTITTTVTDSRGRTDSASESVNVLAYESPKIRSLYVYRSDASGNSTSSGEYLAVKFSASVTSLNSNNIASYVVKYKKASDASYTTETLSGYSNQYAVTDGIFIFSADTSSSYNVAFNVSDAFSDAQKNGFGPSIKKLFSIGKKIFGFAFGKVVELADTLDIGLKTLFRKDVTFQNGKVIYFENVNADSRNVLTLNSSNNVILGYGGYDASEGKTFIFGHAVNFKSNSSFSFDNSLIISNGKAIYIANSDGAAKNVVTLNSDNKVNIGYGLYADSVGSTNIYGNDIGLKYKGSMYINNSALSDFVVASGVSGNWYYRKWESGFAECWMNYIFTPSSWTTNGNMYWTHTGSISLPFTFKTLVTVSASVSYAPFAEVSSGHTQYGPDVSSISAVVMQFYNSSITTMQLGFYCFGKWK